MTGHRYTSGRPIAAGDAAYLIDGSSSGGGYAPCLIVRVNRRTVTIRNRYGNDVRLPFAMPTNNVQFAWAGDDEDEDHELMRAGLVK